ncbi:MAG: DNA-3-methyladenine glycosylase I [Chthoniobacteraceae bacterium]
MSKPPPPRCPWCPADDPLYIEYHDREWGVPVTDGAHLFAMLNLEGAQAGLSWRTILHKRERYYEVFEGFDPARLAKWSEARAEKLLEDPGIVRNRLKVHGVVKNARAVQKEFGGHLQAFSDFLWSFPGWPPLQNEFREMSDYPAKTEVSDRMSKELRKRGFTFVGSTICYAFMQAVGMVNDHAVTCFRREPVRKLGAKRMPPGK